jgi:hypothetical protein
MDVGSCARIVVSADAEQVRQRRFLPPPKRFVQTALLILLYRWIGFVFPV